MHMNFNIQKIFPSFLLIIFPLYRGPIKSSFINNVMPACLVATQLVFNATAT